MKKKTKIGLGIVASIAIIGTTGILTQIGLKYANNHNESIVSKNKITKKDENIEQNISNVKINTNKFNLQKINKNILLKLVDNNIKVHMNPSLIAIKNYNYNNAFKYESLLKSKTNSLIENLYSDKISINSLLSNEQSKYSSLSSSQKEYISNLINSKKNEIDSKKNTSYNLYFSKFNLNVSSIAMFEGNFSLQSTDTSIENNISEWQTELANDNVKLGDFAIASWVIAAASTITAAAIWAIPFFGWVAESFATADTVIDWITANIAQAAYDNSSTAVFQLNNTIMTWTNDTIAPDFLLNDLVSVAGLFKNLQPILVDFANTFDADWATNIAGAFAEPGEYAEFIPFVVTLGFITDLAGTTITYWSTILSNNMNILNKDINNAERNNDIN